MSSPVLSVRNVTKSFATVRAVDGVSFDVREGEIFGFLGPNGAGKTTTLRMLMGITRPDDGAVEFSGSTTLDRSRVGYLPEERGLYEDATCHDTLVYLGRLRRLSRAAANEQAQHWLQRMGLTERAREKVSSLSKGNQQKIQFAGAVLHDPTLAVLDEPFSGLDPLNQELFIDLIRELRDQGTAVLLSAHQLDLVERLCDRFLLISNGRELLHGTLQDVRRRVAGGAEDLLTVAVCPGDGNDTTKRVAQAIGNVSPDLQWRTESLPDGSIQIEVAMPHGVDLSPILTELGDRFRISNVDMRPLRLHEIYVRAVRDDDAQPAGATADV